MAYFKGSGGQTDPELTDWLTGLDRGIREKLVSIGLLSSERVAVSKTLSEHLGDFGKALIAKGCSPRHVELVTGRARRIIKACGFKYHSDIKASPVMEYLNDMRADSDKRRGISAQTFNFYLSAMKQFCRWMVKDRRALESPVAHLDGLNVKTDRRRDRRPLTVEELRKLLDTTRRGPDRDGMAGEERALLYWLAVETGLRAGELRSLNRVSFDLGEQGPTVTVEAAYSKHRRQDTLPLRAELAEALRSFLATLMPGVLAFRIPADRKTAARMFREDIEAAGIAYRDEADLARGGVHPKVAQSLARHSTITLTIHRYSHTLVGEQAEALTALPDLTRPATQQARATGTEGRTVSPEAVERPPAVLASCLALSERSRGILVDSDRRTKEEAGKTEVVSRPAERLERAERTGFEPVEQVIPAHRFSKPALSATQPPLR